MKHCETHSGKCVAFKFCLKLDFCCSDVDRLGAKIGYLMSLNVACLSSKMLDECPAKC